MTAFTSLNCPGEMHGANWSYQISLSAIDFAGIKMIAVPDH